MHRNRLLARADLERDVVVVQQQAKLLEVIGSEQIRSGQGRFINARPRDETIAQPRVGARHGFGAYANEGVAGADTVVQFLARDEALERGAQVGARMLVDRAHVRQCGDRMVEVERSDE